MKRITLLSLALSLLVGMAAAQHGQDHQKDHHDNEARGEAHAQQHRSARQQRDQQVEQRQVWQQHRADQTVVVRSWRERGGYQGPRIAVSYYRVHYGPTHIFRVYREPFLVVAGVPRFQYAGYWFSVVDPVPVFWGPAWYQNDDVYVVEQPDGYYLYNARFPRRPGVAISVVF